MASIILDPEKDATPPVGHIVLETEVDFLREATSGKSLFIRGKKISKWARAFYSGRGIPYSEQASPVRKLCEIYDKLSRDQAAYIVQMLGKNVSKLETYTAREILNSCFPVSLWNEPTSIQHAAKWLLWLDEIEPDSAFTPLFKANSIAWGQTSPNLTEIYEVIDYPSGRKVLQKWLGVEISPFLNKYGAFPLSVPDKWVKIQDDSWRKNIVETKGTFFGELLYTPIEWQFKHKVAEATLSYLETHAKTENFEPAIFDQVSRFLSGNDLIRLRKIQPINLPSGMPDEPISIIKWFTDEYLPYREWQSATNNVEAYKEILDLGKAFGLWYLDFYPKAITAKKYLSFYKSKYLKEENTEHVILLVILDGLHALDARFLKDCLLRAQDNRKLELTELSYSFAPIPTVTDFAKGALLHGVQPAFMKDFDMLGEVFSEQKSPIDRLQNSEPGDLVIWRIQEPDYTYHKENSSANLRKNIEGELSSIAGKIVEIAEKIQFSIPLQIVVSTDHGRFLGVSERTVDTPEGMEAHGRAAWGKAEASYDKSGYVINGDIAYLSKERFGLIDDDAAIILSDHAFRHNIYKREISSHGGVFPEEVLIPWMVFERNVIPPNLDLTVSGEGAANNEGELKISVINPSSIQVVIFALELEFGGDNKYYIATSQDILGLDKQEFLITIPNWPSSDQIALGQAHIMYRLPSGEEIKQEIDLSKLKVVELYKRDTGLFDELGLS